MRVDGCVELSLRTLFPASFGSLSEWSCSSSQCTDCD